MAADDEFLIEKSPPYSLGENEVLVKRAKRMKKMNPDLKVFIIICDPISRIYSHITHMFRQHKDFQAKLTVADMIDRTVQYSELNRFNKTDNDPKHLFDAIVKLLQFTDYWTICNAYRSVFGDNFLIADGEAIRNNPGPEFERLLNFFGLKNPLKYKFNSAKGFYCLDRPVPYCLPGMKGVTRQNSTVSQIPIVDKYPRLGKLRFQFTDHLTKIFMLVRNCTSLQACCDERQQTWLWLKEYICF